MKPDPQIRALLERAAARVPVDVEEGLDYVHHASAPGRRARIASIAVAAAVVILAVALVWNNVAADRSFVQGTGGEPSGRIAIAAGPNLRYGLLVHDLTTGTSSEISVGGTVTDASISMDGSKLAVAIELADAQGEPTANRIVVMNVDGSDQRIIREQPDGDLIGPDLVAVSWSPDGTRIALSGRTYGRGRTVSIIDADGSNEVVLDGHWEGVDWSPDGERLALIGWLDAADEGRFDLWTAALNGTGFQRLTRDTTMKFQPDWSPDGEWIAFQAGVTGDPIDQDVLIVHPDGSGRRLIGDAGGFDGMPVWSADGGWIAFASDREATDAERQAMIEGRSNHGLAVFVLDPDGGGATRIELRAEVAAAFPLSWGP